MGDNMQMRSDVRPRWLPAPLLATWIVGLLASSATGADGMQPAGAPALVPLATALIGVACMLAGGAVGYALFAVCRRTPNTPAQRATSDSYRIIAQAAGDVAFEYNPDHGQVTWTSDLAADLLGYDPGEMVFGPAVFDELVHPSDLEQMHVAWEDLPRTNRLDLEIRLRQKNGGWFWVHLDAVPVNGNHGHASSRVLGIVRKTQALHAAEDALIESRRVETVGTMAGGIAHEFNNHLTPIRGYLELAIDELGPNDPVSEGLQTALERVEYCSDLVAQIQAYGRKSLLIPQPEDLVRLLPTTVRLAMSRDREKAEKITLVERFPESLSLVWVDKAQLSEAMIHLVENAFDAMPNGGTLTVRLEEVYVHNPPRPNEGRAEPGAYVCISVMDTGVGIPLEHQPQIFDPFFTTRSRASARGMGLSMVQGMVAQHDGYIEVQSTPGQGTHVRLFLPAQPVEKGTSNLAKNSDGTMEVLPAAPVGTMMIADDEASIRGIVQRVFAREGWVVETVSDASAVVERLRSETAPPLDLLILDLTMPGPPAEETLNLLRTRGVGTRVLLISGFDRDARIEKISQMDSVDFIGKPFSPKQILSKVDDLLAVSS